MAVPKYDELFNPLLKAMRELGGSASTGEMEEKVAEILNLSEYDINEIHKGSTTKLSYRLAWTRNYLKRFGILENSSRGIWSFTAKGNNTTEVDKEEVKRKVKELDKSDTKPEDEISEHTLEELDWKEKLLEKLKQMPPNDFERLCQRVLREAGFVQVKVTGKSGDGGIDGTGIVKVGGFLSFRVIFQSKRYKNSVGSKEIREFKGTMVGRADKGLFITTGTFTREAQEEATRDGSIPIDLIDGLELVEKMKELGLGVVVKSTQYVEIDNNWFNNF